MMDMQQQPQPQHSSGAPPGFVLNNLCRNNNNLILDNLHQLESEMQHVPPQEQQGAHGTSFQPTNMTLAADILGFHTNPINLGVNAEFAAKSKTQPKGNKKRSRQMQMDMPLAMPSISRAQNQGDEDEEEDANLNRGTAANLHSKKSKFFESLKENVRSEVSNLIENNDLQPYFLIQLFMDLQLMSSSDPTRHQTLQSIQSMYNRYVESTIQEEAMFGGGATGGVARKRPQSAGEEEEEEQQNLSTDEMDNRILVNDLRMEAKTDNELVTRNREARRRDNQLEDSLRRQNKRRYRNRVNEIADKQNYLGQHRLGLGFPTSSGSSQSTPLVSDEFFSLISNSLSGSL